MKIVIDTEFIGGPDDDEDDPQNWKEISIPAKYEVCPSCEGTGRSSAYLGAYTSDEWYEQDEEWRDSYMRGDFDRECKECKGERVVLVPDESRADPELLERYNKQQEDIQYLNQLERMEMGYL